jgi:glycosyltransferase involved in cell wall biosynthesis
MGAPRFSVVIPTRERPDTLRYTLRTCLAQDFDDFEIVVGDNGHSPTARQVVDELASPRIRYFHTPRPLAMSSSWEFAFAQARGEYVFLVGDDDALLSYALRELDGLITRLRPQALRWTAASYSWPTIDLPGEAHYLRLPLGRELRTVEALPTMAAVVRFEACYTSLPTVYNAAIHRDVLARLRERTGRLFGGRYPDVYSGFAVAYLIGDYVSLDLPLSVSGLSGASYGIANLFNRGKSARDLDFRSLNDQERVPTHPWVPELSVFPPVQVADSFLVVKEALFPDDERLSLDRRDLARRYVNGLRADDEGAWREALALIRGTFADDPESQAWFDATCGNRPFRPAPQAFRVRNPYLGPDEGFLHLSADAFGVSDVEAAAQLCEKLLGAEKGDMRYGVPPRDGQSSADRGGSTAAQVRQLQRICEERLHLIEELARAAEERLAVIHGLDGEVRRVRAAAEERELLLRRLQSELRQVQAVAQDREAFAHSLQTELGDVRASLQALHKDREHLQGLAGQRLALLEARDGELQQARALAAERLAVVQSQQAEIQRLVAAEQARLLTRLRRAVARVLPGRARTFARRLLRGWGRRGD